MKLAWSNRAKEDLDDLQRYSVGRWGRDVALRYLDDVRFAAKSLADDPGRARPLKGAFRILRVRSHCLLIHVDTAAERITIARVLHATMDIWRHLP